MRVFDSAALPAEPVDPATFTGAGTLVRMSDVVAAPRVHAYRVAFQPRTRTAWHEHSGTQLLLVLEGTCRVQAAGEPVREVGAGGLVQIAPGERHWHGAGPDAPMTHIALNIEARTSWFDQVTDEEYEGAS